ncbi:MAG: efflux RND transporter periplasmic adaptor subunit [Candidatus Obscuribacterales bacterium]
MKQLIKREETDRFGERPEEKPGETPVKGQTDWLGRLVENLMTSRKWQLGLIVVIVAACVALGIRIYSNLKGPEGEGTAQAVLTVSVEPAQVRALERHLKVTGSISARDPLTVGAETGGLRVETVNAEEGDFVYKGQVLATLNSSLLEAELAREEAHLAGARASLDKTIQPNRPMDIARLKFAVEHADAVISQEEANIERAKANLLNAQHTTRRYRELRKEGAVSAEDLDNRETAERTAGADLTNAEEKLRAARFMKSQASEQLKLAVEGGSREDIGMAKASVMENEATIAHIKAQIAQTRIKAPTDGWIVERKVQQGDTSQINQYLFTIVKNNQLEVRAEIPEQDLSLIEPGQEVVFTSTAIPHKTLTGRVREISPLINRDTRMARARIDIPFDRDWLPGLFVSGTVDLGQSRTLTVPSVSVIDKDGRKIVFVLEKDSKVYSRAIKTGERTGDLVEVTAGLKAGEKVVTAGGGFLKDGDLVRIGSDK